MTVAEPFQGLDGGLEVDQERRRRPITVSRLGNETEERVQYLTVAEPSMS